LAILVSLFACVPGFAQRQTGGETLVPQQVSFGDYTTNIATITGSTVTIINIGCFASYATSTATSPGSYTYSDASPAGLPQSSWLATGLTLPSSVTTVPAFTTDNSGAGQFVGAIANGSPSLGGINPVQNSWLATSLMLASSASTPPPFTADNSGAGQFAGAILGTSTGVGGLNSSPNAYSFNSIGGTDSGSLSRAISDLTENRKTIVAWELIYRSEQVR
jgi:hypothetical protein